MFTINDLKNHQLNHDFYLKPTLQVAKSLLGKVLVSTKNGIVQTGQITETEAYLGPEDLASHARFGQTKRNQIMWHQGGVAYIYLIYGIYSLLNIITEPQNSPGGVLIRVLKPIQNINSKTDGPGKICKALNITPTDTGIDLTSSRQLFISDLSFKPQQIIATPRIGINYAPEPWKSKKWRFISLS